MKVEKSLLDDIVWGLEITGNDMTYFLDCIDNKKKRIAFSSSIGNEWPEMKLPEIRPLIERFSHISVREEKAQEWILESTGRKVEKTCDPTMLWNSNFWDQHIEKPDSLCDRYVLIYMPTGQCIKDAIKYANDHRLSVLYINFHDPLENVVNVKPYSIGKWLYYIKHAEALFTASFHGLLFSLYFHGNPFYYNASFKSRMSSLAEHLGIEYREGTQENLLNNRPIEYESVDSIISKDREYSWNLLNSWVSEL